MAEGDRVVGIAAFLTVLFTMTDVGTFRGRYYANTVVTDAGGMRRGDPVQMRGVNIGHGEFEDHMFANREVAVVDRYAEDVTQLDALQSAVSRLMARPRDRVKFSGLAR